MTLDQVISSLALFLQSVCIRVNRCLIQIPILLDYGGASPTLHDLCPLWLFSLLWTAEASGQIDIGRFVGRGLDGDQLLAEAEGLRQGRGMFLDCSA